MHPLRRAGVAASLLALLFVPPVSAAVGVPTNVYIAEAAFTFVDRGVEWSGLIHVVDDRLNGVIRESVFFARQGPERVCYVGTPDEFISNDYIEFFGVKFDGEASVRDDLSSASVELTAIGQRVTLDGCTGEELSSRVERHTFDAKLTGTGEISTETSDVLILLPDGQIVPGTNTTSSRPGEGSLEVDRIDAVVTDASLVHSVSVRT